MGDAQPKPPCMLWSASSLKIWKGLPNCLYTGKELCKILRVVGQKWRCVCVWGGEIDSANLLQHCYYNLLGYNGSSRHKYWDTIDPGGASSLLGYANLCPSHN